jgi:uncharacterized membrane protein
MNRFRLLLATGTVIALPAALAAQRASLEICNRGKFTIDVAYAQRIQLLITGYRWSTEGFYPVDAGTCKTVYDEPYDAAGPITPQSGARIALVAFTENKWRTLLSNNADTLSWMKPGHGKICIDLKAQGFTYDEPQGDPAANCGVMTVPATWDFFPDDPGQYSYGINWEAGAVSIVIAGDDKSAAESISYFCSSTDKRPVVYFSDIFEQPDAGSDADNFLTYERDILRFEAYLTEHYGFPDKEGLVECVHVPTTASTAGGMVAGKQKLRAMVTAAGKKAVETNWNYVTTDETDTSDADVTRGDVETLTPRGRAALFNWIQADVATYLVASKTGFNSYKSGDVILQQGLRMWTSSEKPALARGCWVVQGDSTTTLSCTLPIDTELERAYYDLLVEDVAAGLPAGWSAGPPNPFGGSLPSSGFVSTTGAHAEIWLTEPQDEVYELSFQLVAAPVRH